MDIGIFRDIRSCRSVNADSDGRAVEGVGLRPLACWDSAFVSRLGNGRLSLVCDVCFQIEVCEMGRSFVQRSPTGWCVCVCVSLSVINFNNILLHLQWVGGKRQIEKEMLVNNYQSTLCTFHQVCYLQPHHRDHPKYHIKINFNPCSQLLSSPLAVLLLQIHFSKYYTATVQSFSNNGCRMNQHEKIYVFNVMLKIVSVFSDHLDDPWGHRSWYSMQRGHVPLFNFPCEYWKFCELQLYDFANVRTDISVIQALILFFLIKALTHIQLLIPRTLIIIASLLHSLNYHEHGYSVRQEMFFILDAFLLFGSYGSVDW
jgi:hypothetical protein